MHGDRLRRRIRRRPLLPLGLQLLRREPFLQNPGYFAYVELERGADLFRPEPVLALAHEADDLIERRRDLLGRSSGKPAGPRGAGWLRRTVRDALWWSTGAAPGMA